MLVAQRIAHACQDGSGLTTKIRTSPAVVNGSEAAVFPERNDFNGACPMNTESLSLSNRFRMHAANGSVLGLALDFTERESVGDHFNIDFSSGWYAHGDRVKAASSAGSR